MLKRFILACAIACVCSYAWGQGILNPVTPLTNGGAVTPSNPLPTAGAYPGMIAGSTLTRANNTTTYTANTAVCTNTSTTVCAPITISLALTNGGKGIINRVTLLKSSSTTTNASFNIWFYSAAPTTANPSLFDDVNYTGPYAADMPNFLGSATCSTANATSDTSAQTWYECSLNNPNTAGAIEFQAVSGTMQIDALISVTAAYAPAAQETFKIFVGGIY